MCGQIRGWLEGAVLQVSQVRFIRRNPVIRNTRGDSRGSGEATDFLLCLPGGTRPAGHRHSCESGLGLIEVILFFSVFVLLVGLISPMVIQQIVNSRVESTREEMQQIQNAILGDTKAGTYGFVGDMGRPPVHLKELRSPVAGTPLYTINHTRGVGMGWNGPYINWGRNTEDYLTDAFGTDYDYGRAGFGQLRSAGPDLIMGTFDDLLAPPQPVRIAGRLAVTVRVFDGPAYLTDSNNCSVSAFYSDGGAERFVNDSVPPYLFENLPRGFHAVSASCGNQSASGQPGASTTTAVQGYGQTNLVELAVAALQSTIAVTARSVAGSGADSLTEARNILLRQQNLILRRSDLSPMLKGQYEAARNRVISSIELAVQQRDNKDPAACRRNLERALTELDVLCGFVRRSPIGNPQAKENRAILDMEIQIREHLAKSIPSSSPPTPPK